MVEDGLERGFLEQSQLQQRRGWSTWRQRGCGVEELQPKRTLRLLMVSVSRLAGGDPNRKRLEKKKLSSAESNLVSGTCG